ncbi:ribonuclease D [Pseudoclavibacter chungangensis]|uniref:Ribonuclease D n=1 Tax=Pseudoclavibacter chungangensis TaxID=587635 RepID=A0A7J5BQG4_9MICO|nr:HRDC domain-containing protein [Pseudoclavibacter chungangensis]KAB1656011.1 ribonuclease D [Pseudoclavibacter chungangensis]NYJ66465.1 ribonuclease D [Pseudoclavibacter chungangensis]
MTQADEARIANGGLEVIDTPEAFARGVARIAEGEGPVAVDAERASGYRYSDRAYLVQLYRRGAGTLLIDPLPIGSLAALGEAIHDEEWVFHAATQDLPCLREIDLDPATIFDTELGARLLGMERVGLGAVVEELLGITLAKAHSADDWSVRPLPTSWLAYAALDVELLVDVRDLMAQRLVDQGKDGLARQEFDDILVRELGAKRSEPWRRMNGYSKLRTPRAQAIARELWLARDAYARETDNAPGRIVPDRALTAAAAAMPSSRGALQGLKEFTGRESRSQLDRWWAAIEAGRSTTDLPSRRGERPAIPPHRSWAHRAPDADARLRAGRAAVERVAETLGMPVENVLTPDYLRRVAWEPPTTIDTATIAAALAASGARPWQVDAVSELVARAFVEVGQPPAHADETAS